MIRHYADNNRMLNLLSKVQLGMAARLVLLFMLNPIGDAAVVEVQDAFIVSSLSSSLHHQPKTDEVARSLRMVILTM